MKKFQIKKLLCYLLISLFIMGIGGEKVFADDLPSRLTFSKNGSYSDGVYVNNVGLMDFRNGIKRDGGNRYHMFSTTINGRQADAYCLDSKLSAPTGSLDAYPAFLSEYQKRTVALIIQASEEYSNEIPNKARRYYVTQALIWEAIGDGPYGAGQGSPYTLNLNNWIKNNFSSFCNDVANYVKDHRNDAETISVKIIGDLENLYEDSTGEYLETEELMIYSTNSILRL